MTSWVGIGAKMASDIFCCNGDPELKRANDISKQIDEQLRREKNQFRRTVKILLLGAGESGKSTFLKQMRIIHGEDFDTKTLLEFRDTIYSNIVKGMRVLIDARDKLGIKWGDEANVKHAQFVFSYDNSKLDETVFQNYVESLEKLWQDSGILAAFDRRKEFQLGDSLRYFLASMTRIGKPDYLPVNRDILHARKATKGITEHQIEINRIPFLFVDVGGQRSQRQKWFQCFDGITAILFLASSSEFDQVLMEDRKTNRLVESCDIFETIINNRTFCNVSIILFLNKTDLLEEKLKHGDSIRYFLSSTVFTRISKVEYIPSNQDVLHARKATKGIIEHLIDINAIPFQFVDVGGQRSQRQKWFQCFDGVTAILFLASSSEFDQLLMEDRKTNRLNEACDIFESIINNKTFCKVSIILFLNKNDLLEEKIRETSIGDMYPEFKGNPRTLDDVQKFIFALFDRRRQERKTLLYHHFTTAIDTKNIKVVFEAVKEMILQKNIKSIMMQ